MDENISVMRHPKALLSLWSHHEKSVTIDQKITYMGGLDLCFGRYDNDQYYLREPESTPNSVYFPGQDYSNVRIHDFIEVDDFKRTLINKDSQPRMPWRDIAIKLKGMVTKDITRLFIQYWSFAKYDVEGKAKKKDFLFKKAFTSYERIKQLGGLRGLG